MKSKAFMILFSVLAAGKAVGLNIEEHIQANGTNPGESGVDNLVIGESEPDQSTVNATKDSSGNEMVLSDAIYLKAHSYFRNTKAFKNYTFQDTVRHLNEISSWVAPQEYHEKFAYNHSGYDHDGQPVWMAKIGAFDIREQTRKGPEAEKNLTQYLFQASLRILQSMAVKDIPTKEIRRAFLLADAENIDTSQGAHIPTVHFLRHLANTYGDFYALGLGRAVIINTTPLQQLAFPTLRPMLGESYDKVELHGYDKAKWQPALRKLLPLSAIPTWYGGSEEYKPTQVFG